MTWLNSEIVNPCCSPRLLGLSWPSLRQNNMECCVSPLVYFPYSVGVFPFRFPQKCLGRPFPPLFFWKNNYPTPHQVPFISEVCGLKPLSFLEESGHCLPGYDFFFMPPTPQGKFFFLCLSAGAHCIFFLFSFIFLY